MWYFIYNVFLYPLLFSLAKIASSKDQKLKQSLEGKRDLFKRLDEAMKRRDPKRKIIWFHVASAGEYLQSQPVLEKFLNNDFDLY